MTEDYEKETLNLLRKTHDIAAYIPLLWIVVFLMANTIAYIKLGHIPMYGSDPAPSALGITILSLISIPIAGIGFATILFWPFIFIHLLLNRKKIKRFSFLPLIAFLTGVGLFIYLSNIQTSQFLWFND